MAYLIACADGDFTAAATWAVADATSLLDSQVNSTSLTTSFVSSQGFTPGAIEIDGIAVKVARHGTATPTGTMTVRLATGGVAVAGTTVTINVTDIPVDSATASNSPTGCSQGWIFLKFATAVTLSAATEYVVQASASSNSQITLFRNATAGNWSRMLRTTTTKAPEAGDSLFVVGERTAAGTMTARAVDMDNTDTTDYGGTDQNVASLGIGDGGSLTWKPGADRRLRLSGVLQKWRRGILRFGTEANPVTGIMEFDCASAGDFGLVAWCDADDELEYAGVPQPYEVMARLSAPASSSDTVLAVDRETGWTNGQSIVIAGTERDVDAREHLTVSASDATTVTVTSGLSLPHAGDPDGLAADIVLLDRPLTITVTNTGAPAYQVVSGTGRVKWRWTRWSFLGTSTANRDTFTMIGSTVNLVAEYSGADGSVVTMLRATDFTATLRNCTFVDPASSGVSGYLFLVSGTWAVELENVVAIAAGLGNTNGFSVTAGVLQATNLRMSGFNGANIVDVDESGATFRGQHVGIYNCTCPNGMIVVNDGAEVYLEDFLLMRGVGTSTTAIQVNDAAIFRGVRGLIRGNNGGGIQLGQVWSVDLIDTDVDAEASFSQPFGIAVLNTPDDMVRHAAFRGCTFGTVGHSTADVNIPSANCPKVRLVFDNSSLNSSTPINNPPVMYSEIAFQREGGVAGDNRTIVYGIGEIARDANVYRTAAPSRRLDPTGDWRVLRAAPKQAAIRQGQRFRLGVYGRVDNDFNGEFRLVLLANASIGVLEDTVLATHSGVTDTWELMQGDMPDAATDDGVVSIAIEATGTAGSGWVDDWQPPILL